MDALKEWMSTILIAAFIINLIDLVLPSGNLKPYINLVLSFILILIIVTPLADLLKKDMSLEDSILKEYNEFEYKYNQKLMSFDNNIDKNKIKENYSSYLKESVNIKLKEYGYEVKDIDLENNEIKNLVIKETKSNKNSNNEQGREIKLKENENYKETFNGKTEDQKHIKNEINKIFKVSIEKIQIN